MEKWEVDRQAGGKGGRRFEVYFGIAPVRPLRISGLCISELCLKVGAPGILESLTGRGRKKVAVGPGIWNNRTISVISRLYRLPLFPFPDTV